MLRALIVFCVIGFAAVMMNEGIFSAGVILVCVVLSGLLAFNFFEPLADLLESTATFTEGYGDFLAIMILFSVTVTLLRIATEHFAPTMIEFPELMHRGGGFLIGGWMGWVFSGILIAAMQTLPLPKEFLGHHFDAGLRAQSESSDNGAWNVDRQWLAYVNRASAFIFDYEDPVIFDPKADFAFRYHRFRRIGENGEVPVAAAAKQAPDVKQAPAPIRKRRS